MRGLARYVTRNLGRHRLRTAAAVLGIFLTMALLSAIQIGLDSISASYTDLVALQAGRADLVVSRRDGHLFLPDAFDPSEVATELAAHPELGASTPRWTALAQVEFSGQQHQALLLGLGVAREQELDLSGLEPAPQLSEGGCAVSRALAKRLSVTVGDSITLSVGPFGTTRTVPIQSVIDRQLLVPQEIRELVIVDAALARDLLGEPTRVHLLAAGLRESARFYDSRDLQASVRRLRELGDSVAAGLGMDYRVSLPKAGALMAFQDLASPLRAGFGVFVVLALCVTGLLVYSIISVAVEERIREFGILRTVGARRADIFRLVLGESALLCLLGVLPGALAGVGVARALLALVGLILGGGAGAIALAWSTAHLCMILGVGAALAIGGAMVPAFQATRWTLVDALDPLRRGQVHQPTVKEGGVHRSWLLTGLALSLVSVVVFFVLPTAFLSGDSSLMGSVVLGLLLSILVGFALLAVSALPWVERPILRVLQLLLGPAAELGARNLFRYRRRNNTTALMFILSVALVVFVASLVALFSRTALNMVEHFNGAELRLQSDDPEAGQLREGLRGITGVTEVSVVRFLKSRSSQGRAYDVVLSDLVGLKHLWLVPFGVDESLPRVLYTNHVRYAAGGPEDLLAVAAYRSTPDPMESGGETPPPVVLSQAAARFLDVRVGDRVELGFHLGAERRDGRFRVAAICSTLPGFAEFRSRVAHAVGSGILLPAVSFNALTQGVPTEARVVRYLVKTETDRAVQQAVAGEIRDRYDLRFRFGVKSVSEQQTEAIAVYWTTQVFFGLLVAVAVSIAVFALIASMASAVMERRWEVGMLKALGLRRSQLLKMFLSEALGISLASGVTGGGIGFLLAWLFVVQGGALAEIPVVVALPYVTFAATLTVCTAAGVIAAYLPTRRLLRRSATEILRMTD